MYYLKCTISGFLFHIIRLNVPCRKPRFFTCSLGNMALLLGYSSNCLKSVGLWKRTALALLRNGIDYWSFNHEKQLKQKKNVARSSLANPHWESEIPNYYLIDEIANLHGKLCKCLLQEQFTLQQQVRVRCLSVILLCRLPIGKKRGQQLVGSQFFCFIKERSTVIFLFRSCDSTDGVNQSNAPNSNAGTRATWSRGAADCRRKWHLTPRDPVTFSTFESTAPAKHQSLRKYIRCDRFWDVRHILLLLRDVDLLHLSSSFHFIWF